MEGVFDSIFVGKPMSRGQAENMISLLDQTVLNIASPLKKLTVSNILDEDYQVLLEGLKDFIEEKLNFEEYSQDPHRIVEFNDKVKTMRNEFNSFLDQMERAIHSSKKISFAASDFEQRGIIRSRENTSKKSEYGLVDRDEDKENRCSPNLPREDQSLKRNNIEKISLECSEKLLRSGPDEANPRLETGLTGLECTDEVMPSRLKTDRDEGYDLFDRKHQDSSMLIDDEEGDRSFYVN